jgi:hypothetical protein
MGLRIFIYIEQLDLLLHIIIVFGLPLKIFSGKHFKNELFRNISTNDGEVGLRIF